ncbi:hypothetical protein Dimus_038105 [Dionaea muscipula]
MKDHQDDDDDNDDDDDMDDAPQGGHDAAQPDDQGKPDAEKAVEESDDDVPLSKRFHTLSTTTFQKKVVDDDEVVEVENLEKEDAEDVNTFKLEETTVFAYRDEEGNILQLDQENLEALVDIAVEDVADKLMDELAQKVVDEEAAQKEKAELAQVAALAAQLDEEDARVEAAAAAKAKKTKTYSRKRKVGARKSARSVKRKIVLDEEEETDEAPAEAAVEKPKDDDVGTSSRDVVEEVLERQLVVYQGGLSTPVAEPIVNEDADFMDAQPVDSEKNAEITAVCALFEETIKTTMTANEQQTQTLKKMWTELKGFTNFDRKLKGDLYLTLMKMEETNEGRAACMAQTLVILKLIPKTLETHRHFLQNRIKEVITTNMNDSKVVKA